MNQVSVLFVCLGNICRSPTAHAVFRKLVQDEGLAEQVLIDSAGTAAYHVGKHPDMRSMETARQKGIEMMDLRARKVDFADFYEYDYVLAMDDENFYNLKELALPEHYDKIQMFLDYTQDFEETEVPDPYYGGAQGFEHVFALVESASQGLLNHIKKHHLNT